MFEMFALKNIFLKQNTGLYIVQLKPREKLAKL